MSGKRGNDLPIDRDWLIESVAGEHNLRCEELLSTGDGSGSRNACRWLFSCCISTPKVDWLVEDAYKPADGYDSIDEEPPGKLSPLIVPINEHAAKEVSSPRSYAAQRTPSSSRNKRKGGAKSWHSAAKRTPTGPEANL